MPTPQYTVTGTPNATNSFVVEYTNLSAATSLTVMKNDGSTWQTVGTINLPAGSGTSSPANVVTLGSDPCIGITPNPLVAGQIRLVSTGIICDYDKEEWVSLGSTVITTTSQPVAYPTNCNEGFWLGVVSGTGGAKAKHEVLRFKYSQTNGSCYYDSDLWPISATTATLAGSAKFGSNSCIVTDALGQSGAVWFNPQLDLFKQMPSSLGFSAEMTFQITVDSLTPGTYGDGMGLVIQGHGKSTLGWGGHGIGYGGIDNAIGILVDTFYNDPNNYAGMQIEPSATNGHIEIDVNGDIWKYMAVDDMPFNPVSLTSNPVPFHVWVDYNPTTKNLSVYTSQGAKPASPNAVFNMPNGLSWILQEGPQTQVLTPFSFTLDYSLEGYTLVSSTEPWYRGAVINSLAGLISLTNAQEIANEANSRNYMTTNGPHDANNILLVMQKYMKNLKQGGAGRPAELGGILFWSQSINRGEAWETLFAGTAEITLAASHPDWICRYPYNYGIDRLVFHDVKAYMTFFGGAIGTTTYYLMDEDRDTSLPVYSLNRTSLIIDVKSHIVSTGKCATWMCLSEGNYLIKHKEGCLAVKSDGIVNYQTGHSIVGNSEELKTIGPLGSYSTKADCLNDALYDDGLVFYAPGIGVYSFYINLTYIDIDQNISDNLIHYTITKV